MKPEEHSAENVEGYAKYAGATMESGESAFASVGESAKGEHNVVENVGEFTRSKKTTFIGVEGIHKTRKHKQTAVDVEVTSVAIVGDAINQGASVVLMNESSHNDEHSSEKKAAELSKEPEEERNVNNEDHKSEGVTTEININDEIAKDALTEYDEFRWR